MSVSARGSSAAHTALVEATMLKVGALPYVRCWKRVVGLFYRVRKDPRTGKVIEAIAVTVGTPGEPDIDGVLTRWDGVGVRMGIECKTGQAVQSDDQKRFQRLYDMMGAIYILARSPEEALELVERERTRGKP